jgi:hypothetical protein
MGLEEHLPKEGEPLVHWPHFDLEALEKMHLLKLRAPQFKTYSFNVPSIFALNAQLPLPVTFAYKFPYVNIAYTIGDKQGQLLNVETSGDFGINEALDSFLREHYKPHCDISLTIVENPSLEEQSNSFIANVVSKGDGSEFVALVSCTDYDCCSGDEQVFYIDGTKDVKNKPIDLATLQRFVRHYSTKKGRFESIATAPNSVKKNQKGDTEIDSKLAFYTVYHSLF